MNDEHVFEDLFFVKTEIGRTELWSRWTFIQRRHRCARRRIGFGIAKKTFERIAVMLEFDFIWGDWSVIVNFVILFFRRQKLVFDLSR